MNEILGLPEQLNTHRIYNIWLQMPGNGRSRLGGSAEPDRPTVPQVQLLCPVQESQRAAAVWLITASLVENIRELL